MSRPPPRLFDASRRTEERGNEEGRGDFRLFERHRAEVTRSILAAAPAAGGRVALLGAGNANDVDLDALAARLDEIHLVDVDPAALARAESRCDGVVRAKLRAHAPVDLSGLYAALDGLRGRPRPEDVARLVDPGAEALAERLPRGLDVAASCCVLTQMSTALVAWAGGDRALVAALEQAMVAVHLRALVESLRPGGAGLVIADAVSTSTYPLEDAPPDELVRLLDRLAEQKILYRCASPVNLRQLLRRDPVLRARCGTTELGRPWLWTGPHGRTYLVYTLAIRRRA